MHVSVIGPPCGDSTTCFSWEYIGSEDGITVQQTSILDLTRVVMQFGIYAGRDTGTDFAMIMLEPGSTLNLDAATVTFNPSRGRVTDSSTLHSSATPVVVGATINAVGSTLMFPAQLHVNKATFTVIDCVLTGSATHRRRSYKRSIPMRR